MRKVSDLLSLRVLSQLRFVPVIIFRVKNWMPFLQNYIDSGKPENIYLFRNGIKFQTKEHVDAVTIAVVFVKKDYGKIPDNSIVVDIGANIGAFSVYAGSTAKDTTVYAFEPMKDNFGLLTKNIEINKLEKVIRPFNLAIASKKERRKLFLGSSPFHSLYSEVESANFVEIDCISLEDVFVENGIERVDLLKVDCEGAEFEILYNTPDKYLGKIKEIRMEYHNQPGNKENISDLRRFLEGQGYRVTYFKEFINGTGNIWLER